MGQSGYTPPPGGSGGTNYWQLIAGVLSPAQSIVQFFAQVVNSAFSLTAAGFGAAYNDGAGTAFGINITSSLMELLAQIGSAYSQINLSDTSITSLVSNTASNSAQVVQTDNSIMAIVADTSGNQTSSLANLTGNITEVTDASGNNTTVTQTLAVFSVQAESAGGTNEATLEIVDSQVVLSVDDGTDVQVIIDPNGIKLQIAGSNVFAVLDSGEIETNQVQTGASTPIAAFTKYVQLYDTTGAPVAKIVCV